MNADSRDPEKSTLLEVFIKQYRTQTISFQIPTCLLVWIFILSHYCVYTVSEPFFVPRLFDLEYEQRDIKRPLYLDTFESSASLKILLIIITEVVVISKSYNDRLRAHLSI